MSCTVQSSRTFIRKANIKHNNTYTYNNTEYKGQMVDVKITCPLHGDFSQRPKNHIRGQGCPVCRYTKSAETKRLSHSEVIASFVKVHGNTYNYDKVNYLADKSKVVVTCKEHGDFEIVPYAHKLGTGCTYCARRGSFSDKAIAKLYYFKYKGLYKIGITKNDVYTRYTMIEYSNFSEVRQWTMTGKQAMYMEAKILSKYRSKAYKGKNVMKSGNTELFVEDVLTEEDIALIELIHQQ